MIRTFAPIVLILLLLTVSGLPQTAGVSVRVAVAANFQFPFDSLLTLYRGIDSTAAITPVYGASGTLTGQILQGAPFHLFLSADSAFPAAIRQGGRATGAVHPYARGRLILWSTIFDNLSTGLAMLGDPRVRTVAVADSALAPYGRAALEALKSEGLLPSVRHKFIYARSVAQVNTYVQRGVVDAGITAASVLARPGPPLPGWWVTIPGDRYTPIVQSAVLLDHGDSEERAMAARFLTWLLAPERGDVLDHFGYERP